MLNEKEKNLIKTIIQKLKNNDNSCINELSELISLYSNIDNNCVKINDCMDIITNCLVGNNINECVKKYKDLNWENGVSFDDLNIEKGVALLRNMGIDIGEPNPLETWFMNMNNDLKNELLLNTKLMTLIKNLISKITQDKPKLFLKGGSVNRLPYDVKIQYDLFKQKLDSQGKKVDEKDDKYINDLIEDFIDKYEKILKIQKYILTFMKIIKNSNYLDKEDNKNIIIKELRKELSDELNTNPITIDYLEKIENKYEGDVSYLQAKQNKFIELLEKLKKNIENKPGYEKMNELINKI